MVEEGSGWFQSYHGLSVVFSCSGEGSVCVLFHFPITFIPFLTGSWQSLSRGPSPAHLHFSGAVPRDACATQPRDLGQNTSNDPSPALLILSVWTLSQ